MLNRFRTTKTTTILFAAVSVVLVVGASLDLLHGRWVRAGISVALLIGIGAWAVSARTWPTRERSDWRPSGAYLAFVLLCTLGAGYLTARLIDIVTLGEGIGAGRTMVIWVGILAGALLAAFALVSFILGLCLRLGIFPRPARFWFPAARTVDRSKSKKDEEPRPSP